MEKSNLFAYLRFCVSWVREEKKINEKSYNANVLNTDVPVNLRELVCGDINLVYILTSKN